MMGEVTALPYHGLAQREGEHSPSTVLGTGRSPKMQRIANIFRRISHGGQE
jgi:hypothetical protein